MNKAQTHTVLFRKYLQRDTYPAHKHSAAYTMFRCPSVTGQCSVETDEWIELVFGTEAYLDVSYKLYYNEIRMSSKKQMYFRLEPRPKP